MKWWPILPLQTCSWTLFRVVSSRLFDTCKDGALEELEKEKTWIINKGSMTNIEGAWRNKKRE